MIKKVNFIITILVLILILISTFFQYKEFSRDKKFYKKSILEIEHNIVLEYKNILKNDINTMITVIDTTLERIIRKNKNLISIEAKTIKHLLKNLNKNEIYKYIDKYNNDMYTLSTKESENTASLKIKLNEASFYISINNEKINIELEESIRYFIYKNITIDYRYVWINKIINFHGGDDYARRLIHPNLKNTEGKLLSTSTEDIKGNKPYRDELKGINEDKEVYYRYFFKLINSSEISEKLTYSKLYEKKNWIVSSGIPLFTLNNNIYKRKQEMQENFQKHIYETILFQVFIYILFIIMLLFLRSKLIKYFNETKELQIKLSKKLTSTEKQANTFFNLSINLQIIADFSGKFIQISNSSSFLLGYKNEELINTSMFDLLHPEDMQSTLKEIKELKEGNVSFYFENRFKHKNGEYISLAWCANSNEERTLIFASAQDKSKLKAKEKILLQQSKMAAMGEMIENIAHQWRQPLSVISTLSTNIKLKNELKLLEDNDINTSMNNINSSVQHLSAIINDFRNFFKADKTLLYFKVSACFDRTLNLISSQFKTSNIELIKNINDITLYGLENELIQVFINIINNAKDELLRKKDKRFIFINTFIKGDFLEIKIYDNAGGIKHDVISKVFDSHFTTKEDKEGTGIGLYMSKIILEEHMRGSISVENINFSHNGISYEGAEFTVKVPIHL